MRLTSEIVSDAGLRAAEVLTLRRLDRVPDDDPARGKMARRPWDEQRWEGRDGVRYLVIGKNGLPREIVLRADLADRLEARHLDVPREITDRDVRISQHYNIPGGQAWSQSFTDAAHRALGAGNSPGGHALRHSFRSRPDGLPPRPGFAPHRRRGADRPGNGPFSTLINPRLPPITPP